MEKAALNNDQINKEMTSQTIITVDPHFKNLLIMAKNVAASKATVLITGESGTGKELVSKYIHSHSPRASRRMVSINCAAVPDGLLESELFGHEKGAFTGAIERKIGKFELAHESTLLLDELSELPLHLQAKLLRALQEGEIERLGGERPININVRVVATTNRDLKEMIRKGEFREDLFYRLNVIPLTIPPLRERPRDLDCLSRYFVDAACAANGLIRKRLSPAAFQKLRQWTWPGNVRELQNVIERSVLTTESEIIDESNVQLPEVDSDHRHMGLTPGMTVSEAEKLLILKTLDFTSQNRTHAARMLGISIRTLRNKINEYRAEGSFE